MYLLIAHKGELSFKQEVSSGILNKTKSDLIQAGYVIVSCMPVKSQ